MKITSSNKYQVRICAERIRNMKRLFEAESRCLRQNMDLFILSIIILCPCIPQGDVTCCQLNSFEAEELQFSEEWEDLNYE